MDTRTDGRTHAWIGVTLNAPPPFFEWRGHNKNIMVIEFGHWLWIRMLNKGLLIVALLSSSNSKCVKMVKKRPLRPMLHNWSFTMYRH